MLPVAILAGGQATRLRPLTANIPKSLVPINGEPFISHQLRLLRQRGVEHVVLCVGNRGKMIRDFISDSDVFGLLVDYSWDGSTLLGTAGAIQKALPMLGESFFVIYGDSYLPCDYGAAQDVFLESEKQALMTVFHNEGQWDTSNVELHEGNILAYDKRRRTPRMHHIDYGLGVCHRSVFAALPEIPCDLATVYQDLLARNELAAFEVKERFYEVGSFAGIRSLSELLAGTTI